MVHLFGHYVDAGVFWGIVATLVVGIPSIILAIVAIKKAIAKHDVKKEVQAAMDPARAVSDKDEPLVDYKHFYGDEVGERHEFDFVRERAEPEQIGDKVEVRESKPLEDVLGFIAGPSKMLVICGSGGLGKSRLLIEAAKANRSVRFAQTRLFSKNLAGLASLIRDKAHKNDIIVFDDCHEYSSELESLLNAALRTGAKVIAASRYMSSIEETLKRVHATPEVVELGLMANAAQVVPVPKDVLKDIVRVSEFNPALAVMAYMHWQRHKTLVGIRDSFGLMERVFKDLVEEGERVGCKDTAAFLAELAVRGGLFEDERPMPEHIGLATALKPMGHITWYQSGEKRVYRVTPDKLRDHIIREVYGGGKAGILQPTFGAMLALLPDADAVNVIDLLAIQFRETDEKTRDVWKQACRKLLDKYAGKAHGTGIGFGATLDRKPLELLIDIGYEAWMKFGDVHMVRDKLGDFCAGADKLASTAHLNKAGLFYYKTGEPDKAVVCYEKGAKLAEETGDKLWQATFLGNIGLVYSDKGELDKALKSFEEGLKIQQEIGDRRGQAAKLGNIGLVYQTKGELDKALKYHEEALAIDREIGYREGAAQDLGNIGLIYQDKGELDKALENMEQVRRIMQEIGDRQGEARALGNIGAVLGALGNHAGAVAKFLEAVSIFGKIGMPVELATQAGNLRIALGHLGRERFVAACVKAGMSREAAGQLADQLGRADGSSGEQKQ